MSDGDQGERRIVYCRELDPDTVLHLSRFGDDYMVRRFDGTAPFEKDGKPRYDDLRTCYRFIFERPLTHDESQHPVEDEEFWSRRIAEVNAELLPDLKAR